MTQPSSPSSSAQAAVFGGLSVVESHQASASLPQGLQALQTKAAEQLANTALPTRKTEHWKYSAKRLGDLTALDLATQGTGKGTGTDIAKVVTDALSINIVNGTVSDSTLAQLNGTQGLSVKRFAELSDADIEKIVASANAHEGNELEQLNTALFSDALLIDVSKNTDLSATLLINYVQSGTGLSTPRVFINLEQGARATIVENLTTQDIDGAFCTSQTTAVVGANAKLTCLRMNGMGASYKLSGSTRAILKRDATFENHALCLGASMARHDLHVLMTESGAHCELNGVVVTKESQHFDNHTNIEHIAAHCTSEENYRCIADDSSHIVFNGRIHIHRDAQKTLGEMNNRNLLLSNKAEIDTKPELEIYADDVKCAHGATIGQLNETEVYYLKTRGLTDEQARQMLTLGFVLELVRAVPVEELAESWEATLSELLSFQDK